ncbi:MAG: hypothetical protein E7643_03520 [Ruminococcaceae bacterium]|nr:hypothetical protein [Oscillospiraceae bacterium]
MDQNQNNEFPWRTPSEDPQGEPVRLHELKKEKKKLSLGIVALIVCVAIVFSVMGTYTLTSAMLRGLYVGELQKKQATIQSLQSALDAVKGGDGSDFGKLDFLAQLFESSSYYADKVSEEERLEAVLKAYAAATGDDYAEYYTEEEYALMLEDNVGTHVGIGISVVQTELKVESYSYQTFQVISIFKNSPAEATDLRVGDYIYAIKADGTYLTVAGLGGYTPALNAMRGEAGTAAEFLVFRKNGEGYAEHEFSITRGSYVAESVTYTTAEGDPSIGIVKILEFNLTTPTQFKAAMKALADSGVKKYVFDVRNNPGGDLLSIKAVLSYFLESGDLILSSVDNKGNVVNPYYAEQMILSGNYASCTVYSQEIGMYRDLDMVVLCNGNTASAAEVFTATLRDYGLAPIVGETTYGKGIMQSVIGLSSVSGGVYDGYVKMTTYAYVTQCGITYHEIGIEPTVGGEIPLDEAALEYNVNVLPQSLDNQLQAAISELK